VSAVGDSGAVCATLATCTPLTKSRIVAPSKVVARWVQLFTGIAAGPNTFLLPLVQLPPTAWNIALVRGRHEVVAVTFLSTIARHPIGVEVGKIHASSVIAVVRRSDGASGIVTCALVPLTPVHCRICPWSRPFPLATPLLFWPETSRIAVPVPSSNPYARPGRWYLESAL
jgi:hypothetical protein